MTMGANAGNGSHSDAEGIESLYALLQARAKTNPSAVAISAPGRADLTYRGLLQQVETTVKALREFGINRNDRVALVLPNGPELATSFLSIACGATCAPLNPAYKAEEFDFYLSDMKARALIIEAEMNSPAREIARKRNISIIELVPAMPSEAGVFSLAGNPGRPADGSFAQPDDAAMVLHTSGTTSRPKLVPLTHVNICSSGRNVARTLALTQNDRCLNVMPLFHIHGLIAAVVASLTAGARVICTPDFDPSQFFTWLDSTQPTWYTAVPTIHQAVLSCAAVNRQIIARRPLRFIRSSSAALPKPVLEELESVFQTQVIEAYGMTEASHQMASNPLSPRIRKPTSVGIAAGPEIAIMDDAGHLLSAGEIGEVVVRGRNITSGYENNPAANQTSFTNGWFRTGDQGRLDEDGYLFLTGRLKEIINRGGEKIAPREVDEVLMQHPAIAQAVTFAVPHATLGEEVAAAVVLKEQERASANDVREFVAARLSDHKVPKQVLIVKEIPKGPTGKLQRIGLAEKLAEQLACDIESRFVAPRTSIEEEVTAIWSRLMKAAPIGIRDNFHSIGGDSLSLAQMLVEVRTRWGVDLPVSRFLACPTVETVVQCVLEGKAARAQDGSGAPARKHSAGLRVQDSLLGGLRNRLFQYIALYVPGYKTARVWLHRKRGVSIGTNVSIGLSVLIETAYPRLISLGNNVSIGIRAVIIGHLRDSTTQALIADQPTVRIEDDVYIGPGVIVLPNVTIGKGAVVSAGSVVTRSIPPHTLARGNPAVPVAYCGVSLGGGVSYEQFLNQLTPIAARPSEESGHEAYPVDVAADYQRSYEQPGVSNS